MNLRIKINAGRNNIDERDSVYCNKIKVYNNSPYYYNNEIGKEFVKRFKNVYLEHKQEIRKTVSVYVLDYKCNTTINIRRNYSKSRAYYEENSFSYVDKPYCVEETHGFSVFGSGFVAFPEISQREGMEGYTTGSMKFYSSPINLSPKLFSNWDVTQANYHIALKHKNIKCDTLSIDFEGATLFSDMYPSPDRITMNSIEFTEPDKISAIVRNGLDFHAEFIELKELSAFRMFLLTAIVSILIALLTTVIAKYVF